MDISVHCALELCKSHSRTMRKNDGQIGLLGRPHSHVSCPGSLAQVSTAAPRPMAGHALLAILISTTSCLGRPALLLVGICLGRCSPRSWLFESSDERSASVRLEQFGSKHTADS